MCKHTHHHPGQGLIEYLLISVLVIMVGLVAVRLAGFNISGLFSALVGGEEAESSIIFSDDFTSLANWKSIYGPNNWKITDGWLTTKSSGDQRLMAQTNLPADYVINATAQLLSGDGYGIMFRLTQSGANYGGYSFQIDPKYGNKFILRKYAANGTEISKPIAIANPPAGFNFNAVHDVQVSVIGSTYTMSIDGVQVMTASDSTYLSGGVGIRSWATSQVKVDNFSTSAP